MIVISQSTKFLLTDCITYAEFNRSSVGVELKEMALNTQGGGGGGGLVAKSCQNLVTLWTEEPGRLQSLGFFRQEDWSGLPFPR